MENNDENSCPNSKQSTPGRIVRRDVRCRKEISCSRHQTGVLGYQRALSPLHPSSVQITKSFWSPGIPVMKYQVRNFPLTSNCVHCRPSRHSKPASPCLARSPIPPNSPLLSPLRASPTLTKVRSFNKELRRARSFRNAREKSSSRTNSAANSRWVWNEAINQMWTLM